MGNHGGKRPGAGRPTKADEDALVARLSKMDDLAFDRLNSGIDKGDYSYLRLFFEYRFGKPKDKLDVTSNGESITAIRIVDLDGSPL